ncbi:polysaccharide deacetylase family protein [Frankia sp. R82]|uniref:polysaccharide deacetylase family protein n=1 Tax=Frankia sp. R82 TaxID=2950553 RepID=UPI002042F705|nr:polysaccharide deacetylase family protein [Frankia sp. R82]MCM3883454.1 polysaccharide deacetylase family protein [Frankia sp. R82]
MVTAGQHPPGRGHLVPILRYRSFDPHTTRGAPRRPMPLATFARHCQLIAASGRQTMSLSGHMSMIGNAAAPRRPLVITIDDGGGMTMTALRLLVEFGLTATVFVTSSRVGDPGYFHRTDLHRIRGLGIEIGGSGHTGRPLNELARTDVITELTLSRRRLAGAVGDEPRTFAYPGGGYDLSVRQLVISAGYSSACAVRDVLSHPNDDRFALARLTVDAATPDSRLVAWLGGFGHSEPRHPVLATDRLLRLRRIGRAVGPFRPRLGRTILGSPARGLDDLDDLGLAEAAASVDPGATGAPAGSAEPAELQTVGDLDRG